MLRLKVTVDGSAHERIIDTGDNIHCVDGLRQVLAEKLKLNKEFDVVYTTAKGRQIQVVDEDSWFECRVDYMSITRSYFSEQEAMALSVQTKKSLHNSLHLSNLMDAYSSPTPAQFIIPDIRPPNPPTITPPPPIKSTESWISCEECKEHIVIGPRIKNISRNNHDLCLECSHKSKFINDVMLRFPRPVLAHTASIFNTSEYRTLSTIIKNNS